MNDAPDDLDALEARLASRARPAPSPRLRPRVLRGIELARSHERRAWIAACAATLIVTCALRWTMPGLEPAIGGFPHAIAPSELETLGFDTTDAERMVRVWSSSRVPRIAPIQATASLPSFVQGGL